MLRRISGSGACTLCTLPSARAPACQPPCGVLRSRGPVVVRRGVTMFEEAQLYSPVTHDADGKAVVHLGEEHPGFNDPAYRERRNAIATAATAWWPGEPLPHIEYSELENGIWRTVSSELPEKHRKYACREFLEAKAALGLPEDRVPQLDEVTARLKPLTGFEYHPAAGLVPLREVYGSPPPAPRVLRPPPPPRLPPDEVRAPPLRAALHARARHHPRGHRPREHAREPAVRRAQAPRGRGRAARRDRRGAAVHRRRLLVHARVRRRLRGRRAARLRRGHPLVLRRDRGVPRDGDPPDRHRRDGHDRVRHHEVPAGPLRGRFTRAPVRRRRRVLRDGRRRHAGALRACRARLTQARPSGFGRLPPVPPLSTVHASGRAMRAASMRLSAPTDPRRMPQPSTPCPAPPRSRPSAAATTTSPATCAGARRRSRACAPSSPFPR